MQSSASHKHLIYIYVSMYPTQWKLLKSNTFYIASTREIKTILQFEFFPGFKLLWIAMFLLKILEEGLAHSRSTVNVLLNHFCATMIILMWRDYWLPLGIFNFNFHYYRELVDDYLHIRLALDRIYLMGELGIGDKLFLPTASMFM